MSLHRYIAIDLGAESGRVMLGILENGRLGIEELHRFPNGPVRHGGTLRWDVARLWEETKEGLRKVAARGLAVSGVSVDSLGVDYVLMGRDGAILQMPFCYRDSRTEATYAAVRKRVAEEEIYRQTGVQFMPLNTFYQLAAERHDAEFLSCVGSFLMVGDWFHFQLCGRAAQEESNASTTQVWNPRKREWSDDMIAATGLPRRIFPDVVPPCTRLGKLTETVQRETGLGEVEVMAGCVHDTGAAVAAVPAQGAGWAYLSSGTWSLIGVELPGPLITAEGRAANFTNETGVNGTSRFLRNASGLWILQECRRMWALAGEETDYAGLTLLAEKSEPFRSLVNPDDPIFLRPDDMLTAMRDFCRRTGQPEPESKGQFVRCALESLALLYGVLMQQLEMVTRQKLNTLHVVGGGSRNALLNQMTADATARTVIAGPVEATAIGNVLLQALTLGHIVSHGELRAVVRKSFPVETCEPRSDAAWEQARERFSRLR